MPLILQIQTGSRAGSKIEFTRSVVFAGRHPDADLRFDVNAELDVSSRHAEMRSTDNGWVILDLHSTNGTWVNGKRIEGATPIRAGDKILLGAKGPRIEVLSTGSPTDLAPMPKTRQVEAKRASTHERVAAAVAEQTGQLRKFVMALAAVVIVGVGVIVWLNQKEAGESRRAIETLLRQSDSLRNEVQQRVADAEAKAAGFDSIAKSLRAERDRLTRALQSGGDVSQLSGEIATLDRRTRGALSLTNRQVIAANGKAVAYIVVQAKNGINYAGTAFCVTPGGLFVTNRHVLLDDDKQPPVQIAVFLADTDVPLRAHYAGVAADGDLGFVQLDKPGTYPTVLGVGSSAKLGVGDNVILTGFPGGTDSKAGVVKRTTTTYGAISKMQDTVIQMNAFAAQGSSGSPVFDSRGYVIGVLVSGAGGESSVLTYFVPSDKLIAALPPEAKAIVRR